jgi:response regulator RpfG family c-di-GMP phosphodiesterase
MNGIPFFTLRERDNNERARFPRRLILLVDDSPLLLESIGTVLRHAGYDTVTAASASEVLRDHARSSRRKINEIAEEIAAAEELLGGLHASFAGRLRGK